MGMAGAKMVCLNEQEMRRSGSLKDINRDKEEQKTGTTGEDGRKKDGSLDKNQNNKKKMGIYKGTLKGKSNHRDPINRYGYLALVDSKSTSNDDEEDSTANKMLPELS